MGLGRLRRDDDTRCVAHPVRSAQLTAGTGLTALQRTAGNRAVQQLVAAGATMQRYRPAGSMNFGAMDDGTLHEESFKGKKKQPWIAKIDVHFDSVVVDSTGVEMPRGTATATYFSNAHALPSFSVTTTGGPGGLPTKQGNFTVTRIEGAGYNDPTAAEVIATAQGEAALEGPKRGAHRRYTKPTAGQLPREVNASMHLAVFFNKGQALHTGDLNLASHGCVHVFDTKLVQLNYHSVVGRTAVNVKYSGDAKRKFVR